MRPFVSVVIPTRNDAAYLAESIPSIFAQDYPGRLEVIVVDDGSEPPASAVYQPQDARVRLYRQARKGVSAARNTGIEQARGDYIAFLDVDDLMLPGRLEGQIALMEEHPEIGLAGGDITRRSLDGLEESWGIFEAFGEPIPARNVGAEAWIFEETFREQVLRRYPFNTSVMTARRSALENGFRFDPDLICWEDWDFLARLAQKWRIGYCRRPVVLYRKRPGSITTTADPRKFVSRARMFCKWTRELALSGEGRRTLEQAEYKAWMSASYEYRSVNWWGAARCALSGWSSRAAAKLYAGFRRQPHEP